MLLSRMRALIVEDDTMILELTWSVLTKKFLGIMLDRATDGVKAIQLLSKYKDLDAHKLILTDFKMSRMNGIGACKKARMLLPGRVALNA